jgi:hypothetical protein
MATTIIKKEELSSAIMSLQTKQEVADLLAISTKELDQEIQTNFNMTFEQKQKQLKVQIKYSKNNEIIMSKKTDKNTTKLLADNVMTAVETAPQSTTKAISIKHIQVVNHFMEGCTKVESYKKVYGMSLTDNSATKNVANLLARPEVKEYLAERVSEIEVVAKLTKSKVVKHLGNIMSSTYANHKAQITAAAQISKMMGYDAPTETKTTIVSLTDVLNELK